MVQSTPYQGTSLFYHKVDQTQPGYQWTDGCSNNEKRKNHKIKLLEWKMAESRYSIAILSKFFIWIYIHNFWITMKLLGSPDTIIETGVTLENRIVQLGEYQKQWSKKKKEQLMNECIYFVLLWLIMIDIR